MHRALETPVIQLLVFEELDSASSLMACSKVCRKWLDQAMFIRVKNHPVSLLGIIETIAPIVKNAENGQGGNFATFVVPTDRQAITSLDSSRLIGIGAEIRSISFDLALDPCSITMFRGLTRRHNGPIFPRLSSLTIRPEIERWDITSNFIMFDFLLSISSPTGITTVTFANGCDSSYARSMMEFFALSQLPISRLCKGRLFEEDEYPEAIGYDFLWHVSRIELHHPPLEEEWIQLSKCERLEELIICEPLPWVHFGTTMATFDQLQSLEVPWTLLPLLEDTIIPKLKRFTLGSAGVHLNEGPVLLKESVLSALASHSPDLQELRIHDVLLTETNVLRPILSLKNIKVLELLNADWDGVRDKDIERIARSFPLLQTFAFRDRGPHRCKRMLTAASILALARHCKVIVRVELPLSLKNQKDRKSVAVEDQMRCLRCLRIEVQSEDRDLFAFLLSVRELCPSLVDFVIKTTDETRDEYWMKLYYMAVAVVRARTAGRQGVEPRSSGKRSREVFLNLGNAR